MQQIQGSQIRAARAILNWSQEHLAVRSGLAVTTVRSFENGSVPRGRTADIIRGVFENSGIEFTEREGVRRLVEEIKVLYEPDSCFQFFDDILQTVRTECDEILACVASFDTFLQASCLSEKDAAIRLKKINNFARIKCIVPNEEEIATFLPMVELRYANAKRLGPSQYFVYGNKHALILPQGRGEYRFVVFRSSSLAVSYRTHFQDLWQEETLEGLSHKARETKPIGA